MRLDDHVCDSRGCPAGLSAKTSAAAAWARIRSAASRPSAQPHWPPIQPRGMTGRSRPYRPRQRPVSWPSPCLKLPNPGSAGSPAAPQRRWAGPIGPLVPWCGTRSGHPLPVNAVAGSGSPRPPPPARHGTALLVMVAAQQQVNWVGAAGPRREHGDHRRPGRAAARALCADEHRDPVDRTVRCRLQRGMQDRFRRLTLLIRRASRKHVSRLARVVKCPTGTFLGYSRAQGPAPPRGHRLLKCQPRFP